MGFWSVEGRCVESYEKGGCAGQAAVHVLVALSQGADGLSFAGASTFCADGQNPALGVLIAQPTKFTRPCHSRGQDLRERTTEGEQDHVLSAEDTLSSLATLSIISRTSGSQPNSQRSSMRDMARSTCSMMKD